MAFVKLPADRVKVELTAKLTNEEGNADAVKFTAYYKRLKVSEKEAVNERLKADPNSLLEVLRDTLLGWKIQAEDGSEFPFTPENRDLLFDYDDWLAAFLEGYLLVQGGSGALARKNV